MEIVHVKVGPREKMPARSRPEYGKVKKPPVVHPKAMNQEKTSPKDCSQSKARETGILLGRSEINRMKTPKENKE